MHKENIQELIEKYLSGTLSPEQEKVLSDWYSKQMQAAEQSSEMDIAQKRAMKQQIWQKMSKQIAAQPDSHSSKTKKRRFIGTKLMRAAAAILLLIAGGIYYYVSTEDPHFSKEQISQVARSKDLKGAIVPGSNGGTLHLSDGRTILLDSLDNGAIIKQGGVKIIKDNGQLFYVGEASQTLYNEMNTARGQKWQLALPDGTKVWLNAGSSIHYPLSFKGDQRLVTLTGEAYFEVVHNQKKPFRVQVGDVLIEDLGTKFNINAYHNEPEIKTTLIQGSVSVSVKGNKKLLTPSQQAVIGADQTIKVKTVNISSEIGWKNQEIVFDDQSFKTIMHKIERWYNIDVIYQNQPPDIQLQGSISAELNLSQFLRILDFENVRYRLQGRTLTILP